MLYIPAIIIGWLLDLLLGDPAWLPHPVVAFGRWISFCEHHLNHGRRMVKGALVAVASIAAVFAVAWLILYRCLPVEGLCSAPGTPAFWRAVAGQLLSAILIFFCLAGRTLRHEVREVFLALDRSLDDGRRQVARIVGRDTAGLSPQEVRTAALETLAENLSDGVVAPLFWLALLGVPGMLAYKMVNTLDSMIGYRTERYRQFGCWAAHIDDIANYVPARITAVLILVAYRIMSLTGRLSCTMTAEPHPSTPEGLVTFTLRYGPAHASPNSGWPEAALAAVLDCRFGGTHDYFGQAVEKPFIGTNPRQLSTDDMRLSLGIALTAEAISVAATLLASCLVAGGIMAL